MLSKACAACVIGWCVTAFGALHVGAREPDPVLVKVELQTPVRDVFFPAPQNTERAIARQLATDCSDIIRCWPYLEVNGNTCLPKRPGLILSVRRSGALLGQYDFQIQMFDQHGATPVPIEASPGMPLPDVPFIKPGELAAWGGFPKKATLRELIERRGRGDVLKIYRTKLRSALQEAATMANEFRWVLPLPQQAGDRAVGVLPLSWDVDRCRELGFARFLILCDGNIRLVVDALGRCHDYPPAPAVRQFDGLLIQPILWQEGVRSTPFGHGHFAKLPTLQPLAVRLLNPNHAQAAILQSTHCTSTSGASEAP